MNPKTSLKNITIAAVLSFSLALSVGSMFGTAPTASAASVSLADSVIATGERFMGVPYRFGASSNNTSAFDCSSFTQYVYKQVGVQLPRSSRQQSKVGTYVPRDQLQPGDLVFSDTNRDGVINHVSIYMGNGKLLHTYRVGIGVTISTFAGSAWDRTYVTARRVLPSGSGQPTAVTTPAAVGSSGAPETADSTSPDQSGYTSIGKHASKPAKHRASHRSSHRVQKGE